MKIFEADRQRTYTQTELNMRIRLAVKAERERIINLFSVDHKVKTKEDFIEESKNPVYHLKIPQKDWQALRGESHE